MDFPMDFPRFKASSYWGPMETCQGSMPSSDPRAPEDEVAHRSFAQDLGEKASCQASEKPWILWMKYGILDDFS